MQILQDKWGGADAIASRQIGAVHFSTIQISLKANLAKVKCLWIAIGSAAIGIMLSSAIVVANVLSGLN